MTVRNLWEGRDFSLPFLLDGLNQKPSLGGCCLLPVVAGDSLPHSEGAKRVLPLFNPVLLLILILIFIFFFSFACIYILIVTIAAAIAFNN